MDEMFLSPDVAHTPLPFPTEAAVPHHWLRLVRHLTAPFLLLLFTASGAWAQASGAWLLVHEPGEWDRPTPQLLSAQVGTRIRVIGEAYHPAGVDKVLVGGVPAKLTFNGEVAEFRGYIDVKKGLQSVIIVIQPKWGPLFTQRYPVEVETASTTEGYGAPWSAPDSLVLFVGVPDTVRIRTRGTPPVPVPSVLLGWRSTNAGIATVQNGVVRPVGSGSAAIEADGFGRKMFIPVIVYDHPLEVAFSPRDSVLLMTVGERFLARADIKIRPNEWTRGWVPNLSWSDTVVFARTPSGALLALRSGKTTIRGRIAGREHRWFVTVKPPAIRISNLTSRTLVWGDTISLRAMRLGRDGTPLGPAQGVLWHSNNPSVVDVDGPRAIAMGPGRALITAALGGAEDTVTVFVLGELLLSGRHGKTSRLATLSLKTGQFSFIADGIEGASPSLSPDGRVIALESKMHGPSRIYLMAPDGRNVHRLIGDQKGALGFRVSSYQEYSPRWSNDGRRVVFVSNSVGNYEIFSVRPDGSDLRRISHNGAVDWHPSPAPDEPKLAWERVVGAGHSEVIVSLLDGSGASVIASGATLPNLQVSEARPSLLAGGKLLMFARGAPGLDVRDGDALTLYNLTTQSVVADITAPIHDHETIFSVSPDGQLVAYNDHAMWGKNNSVLTIINTKGTVIQTISLNHMSTINSITWTSSYPGH